MTHSKECNLVMIATENESNISKRNSLVIDKFSVKQNTVEYIFPKIKTNRFWDNQYLYVTSNDNILVHDWVLDSTKQLRQVLNISSDNRLYLSGIDFLSILPQSCKKIIASTDESLNLSLIPFDFIKEYCKLNGNINKISVEYEITKYPDLHLLKLYNNTISIKSIKNNWSREEVIELCAKSWDMSLEVNKNPSKYRYSHEHPDNFSFDKWINEKL